MSRICTTTQPIGDSETARTQPARDAVADEFTAAFAQEESFDVGTDLDAVGLPTRDVVNAYLFDDLWLQNEWIAPEVPSTSDRDVVDWRRRQGTQPGRLSATATESRPSDRPTRPHDDRLLDDVPHAEKTLPQPYSRLLRSLPLIWAVGTFVFFAAGLLALVQLVWLRLRLPVASPAVSGRLTRILPHFPQSRSIRLLVHPRVSSPFAFGIRRPVIVLPRTFETELTHDQQDAALAHELAHLTSFDTAWQPIAGAMVAILWWCPLAWFTRWRYQAAMELAADEASLLLPDGPRNLAGCLVRIGRVLVNQSQFGTLGMAGYASRSSLARRVRRLLEISEVETAPPVRGKLLFRLGVMSLFLFCSLLPSVVVRAEQSIENGETNMSFLKQSWRGSLIAGLAAVAMSPVEADAQRAAEEPDVNVAVEVVEEVNPRFEAVIVGDAREQLEVIDGGTIGELTLRVREDAEDAHPDLKKLKKELEKHAAKLSTSDRPAVRRQIERQMLELEMKLRAQTLEHAKRELEKRAKKLSTSDRPAVRRQVEKQLRQLERQVLELHMQHREEEVELARKAKRHADMAVEQRFKAMQDHEAIRREQHVRTAIESLHAAGLHDHAERLMKELADRDRRAESTAKRIFPQRRRVVSAVRRTSSGPSEIDQLRGQMEEMRAEMKGMHRMFEQVLGRLNGAEVEKRWHVEVEEERHQEDHEEHHNQGDVFEVHDHDHNDHDHLDDSDHDEDHDEDDDEDDDHNE